MERIFAKWLYFNEKHEKAPDFVVGGLALKLDSLKELAEQAKEYVNDKGYVRYQITQNRDGKYSISVDTYWLNKDSKPKHTKDEEITIDSIPF